jgi:hypothetical protein
MFLHFLHLQGILIVNQPGDKVSPLSIEHLAKSKMAAKMAANNSVLP